MSRVRYLALAMDYDGTLAEQGTVRPATVAALDMNSDLLREARRLWFETGWLP